MQEHFPNLGIGKVQSTGLPWWKQQRMKGVSHSLGILAWAGNLVSP